MVQRLHTLHVGRTRGMLQSQPYLTHFFRLVAVSVCVSVRMLVNARTCLASPSANPLQTDARRVWPSVGMATTHPAAAADAADADRQFVSNKHMQ